MGADGEPGAALGLGGVVLAGALRASIAFALAVIALPLVAWLDGLRGRRERSVVVGPRGARTALATAFKLLEKRAPRPVDSDRFLYAVAPVLLLIPTAAVPALLPWSPTDPIGTTLPLLLSLPLLSTSALALAGVAGGNRLALLSAVRLVVLRLSALTVVGVASLPAVLRASSAGLQEIVRAQAAPLPFASVLPSYGLFDAPTAALAAVAALAIHAQLVLRARTSATLAEPWVGDATGPALLGYRAFESLDLLAGACLIATLFLGGWHGPIDGLGALVLGAKVAVSLVAVIALRNALPTLQPAVAVRACWLVLVPLAAAGVATTWWSVG